MRAEEEINRLVSETGEITNQIIGEVKKTNNGLKEKAAYISSITTTVGSIATNQKKHIKLTAKLINKVKAELKLKN